LLGLPLVNAIDQECHHIDANRGYKVAGNAELLPILQKVLGNIRIYSNMYADNSQNVCYIKHYFLFLHPIKYNYG